MALRRAGRLFPLSVLSHPTALPQSKSSRCRRRHALGRDILATTNAAISTLNALACGKLPPAPELRGPPVDPSHPFPGTHQRAPNKLTNSAAQTRLAQNIRAQCVDFCRARPPRATDPTPAPSSTETPYCSPTTSVPLEVAKLALPETSHSVPLFSLLPDAVAREFADLGALMEPPTGPPPPAAAGATPREYIQLVKLLYRRKMCVFTTQPRCVNGYFAVKKDEKRQRFIFDGRRLNAMLRRPPRVELPTPESFAALRFPPGEKIFAAKADLSNFYHYLRVPVAWRPWLCLPAVRACDVGRKGTALLYPALTRLPMGASFSVYLAQAAHRELLRSTSLEATNEVSRGSARTVPTGAIRHGVVIDDVMILSTDKARVQSAFRSLLAAYRRVGLPVKESKLQRATCGDITLLGIVFNGTTRRYGLSRVKAHALVAQTQQWLRFGKCSGHQLRRLLGKWCWPLLLRRPAFSVLQTCYRYIHVARSRVFTLWPSVRKELAALCTLAPLLSCSLSPPLFRHLVATDACPSGKAVVCAQLPWKWAHNLPCHPSIASPPLEMQDWTTIAATRVLHDRHINALELSAVVLATYWLSSYPSSLGSTVVLLCDSMVALGTIWKGRSSSFALLPQLRRLAAVCLAGDVHLFPLYVASADNPADAPSRRYV